MVNGWQNPGDRFPLKDLEYWLDRYPLRNLIPLMPSILKKNGSLGIYGGMNLAKP